MNQLEPDAAVPSVWKEYLALGTKFILIFYVETFLAALYIMYLGGHSMIADVIVAVVYAVILVLATLWLIKRLPLVAIMLAAPTVPLFMLLLVITMMPILQVIERQLHAVGVTANASFVSGNK